MAPPKLKLRKDVKYIVAIRNPRDCLASLMPFMLLHHPAFAKMWGGFPPNAGKDAADVDPKEFKHLMSKDLGGGTSGIQEFYIRFWRGWWEHRYNSNVLFLHYQNRLRDHAGEIRKIAMFLNVPLTDDELVRISETTSFDFMKENDEAFSLKQVFDPYRKSGVGSQEMVDVFLPRIRLS